MRKILYLGPFEIGKAETDSGVLYPAKKLAETFGDFQFLVTVRHDTKKESMNLWKQRIPSLDFIRLPSPEKAPQGLKTLYFCFLIRHHLCKVVKKYQPTHIYIRDCHYFKVAQRLAKYGNAKIIFKVAGAIIPEAVMSTGRMTWKIRFTDRLIFAPAIRHADILTAVSWRFKSYLEEMYFRSDAIVIPSTVLLTDHVASDSSALRKDLGFSPDDLIVCYSGGASIWQRSADIFRFFSQLHNAEPRIKLLILSYDVERFKEIAASNGVDLQNIVICRVAREEIDRYYAMVDAGICLRHNNLVNNVASPFKIGEYWEAGLPVIMTRGIGEYSYETMENKLGVVLEDDFLNSHSAVEQTVHFLRTMNHAEIAKRCRAWVEHNISIESQLNTLNKLYQ